MHGESLNAVKEMIADVYPDYLDEYQEVVAVADASLDDKSIFVDQEIDSYSIYNMTPDRRKEKILSLCETYGLSTDELISNYDSIDDRYFFPRFTDKAIETICEVIGKNTYLLFSSDENPDWDMQEALMDIGIRYHL